VRIRRTTAALALVAAVIVPAASTTTAAYAKNDSSGSAHPGKPAKTAFTATGTITAVDTAAGTLTVAAKGGTKDVRGTTVTITVGANARIRLNSRRASLSALVAGDKVAVLGTRQSTSYTALQIEAATVKHSPKPAPSASASPSPSDDDSPEPPDDSSHHTTTSPSPSATA
jgi:Cu/Ag efflux protein CusF